MNDFTQSIATAFTLIARFDSELVGIVWLSLRVSLSASIIALAIGAPLGVWLAINRFRGRQALIILANALLGLPPVVAGLAIYLLLSRSGPLGFAGLLFTPTAMIIAQVILTTPIVVAVMHRPASLLTAFLAAFGRAIAEVGAIIIVGGNIRGYTRTMTTTIALETSKGELSLALGLGLILVSLSVTVSTVAFLLVGRVGEK